MHRKCHIIHIHRLLPAWVINPKRIKKHCSRLIVTFWGGEMDNELLLRSHERYLNKLKILLLEADKVVGAGNDNRIVVKYPFIKEKSAYGYFGSSIIDILCHDNIITKEAKRHFDIPNGKVSVLLGYSGKTLHQHLKVLEAIVRNQQFFGMKDRIHLLASMTRSSSTLYADEVEKAMKNSGCSYTILRDKYQTDVEVAQFRKATDILMQLSTFDYLSASVKESLCAGSVMICGSWLPYDVLRREGFYFEEAADVQNGVAVLYAVLDKFDDYKDKAEKNQKLCNSRYSWNACIKDWIDVYDAIC